MGGEPVYVDLADSKQGKINELSDKMATLKWDIWEIFPKVSRADIDESEWNQEIERRLMEYPCLDYEYEKSCVLKV